MLQWTAQRLYCFGAVGEISMTHEDFIMWKKTIRPRLTFTLLNVRILFFFFFSNVMPCKISFSFFFVYNIFKWNTCRYMCNYLYPESQCILIKKYSIDYTRAGALASSRRKSCAGAFIFTAPPAIRQRSQAR